MTVQRCFINPGFQKSSVGVPLEPHFDTMLTRMLPGPEDITVWAWLFQSSSFQKLQDSAPTDIKGVTNTVSGERITYTELKDYAEHLSMALVRNCGLQPGDTVVLLSENSIWFPVAMFAVLRAGARVAGASPASTVDEMSYYLRVCRAKFVMTAPNSANIAVAAAQNVGIGRDRIFSLYGVYERLVGIHHLIQVGAQIKESSYVEAYLIPAGKGNRDICGYLSFTSGTMGRPKAVSDFPLLSADVVTDAR